MTQQIHFTRINNDVNGNPRYVCHFPALLNEGDKIKAYANNSENVISCEYNIALNKARSIGGRKFHNKQYGGGIVFQAYSGTEIEEYINKVKNVNPSFLKEWDNKQFKKVEKAILNHFQTHTYTFVYGEQKTKFRPFDMEEIENLLGLAYTSSSSYAGLWVCNAGYLMADDNYYFNGFALNTDGKVVAILWDKDEKEILMEL